MAATDQSPDGPSHPHGTDPVDDHLAVVALEARQATEDMTSTGATSAAAAHWSVAVKATRLMNTPPAIPHAPDLDFSDTPPENPVAHAAALAAQAHRGQKDKAGADYITHPRRVAARLVLAGCDETTIAAGWLHDVVEDTGLLLEDLRRAGVPDETVRVVGLVTKPGSVDYQSYLAEVAADPAARAVKLADLADNSDPERLALLPEDTQQRLQVKYDRARRLLSSDY